MWSRTSPSWECASPVWCPREPRERGRRSDGSPATTCFSRFRMRSYCWSNSTTGSSWSVERVRNVLAIGRTNFPISSQCYHTYTGIAQGAQPFVILLAGSVPEGQIVVPIIYGYVAGVIVEHCGYVLLGELVPCVGYQHAGFAHHAIAHDGYFQRARTLRYVRRHSRFFSPFVFVKQELQRGQNRGVTIGIATFGGRCWRTVCLSWRTHTFIQPEISRLCP